MSAVKKLKYYLDAPEVSSSFQLKVTAGETGLCLTRTRPDRSHALCVRLVRRASACQAPRTGELFRRFWTDGCSQECPRPSAWMSHGHRSTFWTGQMSQIFGTSCTRNTEPIFTVWPTGTVSCPAQCCLCGSQQNCDI